MEPESEPVAEQVERPTKEVRRRKKQLYRALKGQMEFYFSDANLTKNRIMGQRVLQDPNVDLSLFLTFNKIRALTMNVDDIVKALKKSDMLSVTEDGTKVYRTTPVRENANVDECTVYVENLPPDAEHEWLKSVFLPFGNVPYVSIPKFNVSRMNKGFAFVELESPEAVNRALEAFEARGCLIPTQIPHEQLSSIASFDEKRPEKVGLPNKMEVVDIFEDTSIVDKNIVQGVATDENEGNVKVKEENKEEDEEIELKKRKQAKENDGEEEKPLKKRKKARESEDEEKKSRDDSFNDELENVKHSKRRKSKNGKESETGNTEERKVEEVENRDEGGEETVEGEEKENEGECEEGEEERKKKKSRRHKKKNNKKDVEEVDPMKSLRILPKLEWKRLRNKYLSLQKSKMIELKQHLLRSRWGGNYSQEPRDSQQNSGSQKQEEQQPAVKQEPKRFSFVPGVIVAVRMDEPVSDVKSFKTEARTHTNVLYVDLEEGCNEAFIRCSTSDDARTLLTEQPWTNMSVLEGQAETDYWDKITRDREQKMKGTWTNPTKKRGRDKLLKKAEKALGKHIRFDEHE